MPHVVILTGNTLCHNPRVIKEAEALAESGFRVTVLGAWLDPEFRARDRDLLRTRRFAFQPVLDLTAEGGGRHLARGACRLRGLTGRLLFRYGRLENRWQLDYAVQALGRVAERTDADLFIAHSEAGLVVARDLLRSGRRVAVDMEDWFSEDLPPEARRQRPVKLLRRLEQEVLTAAVHSSCPSRAMSQAIAAEYGCRPPAVIYNAFAWSDRCFLDHQMKDRKDRSLPSIHWYSQTLGHGRGLDDLLSALPGIGCEVEIHLRGRPVAGFDEWLAGRVSEPQRQRIYIHELVPNDELLSRIAEHDIGFAGEMTYARSRQTTVTNKMLHYMLGGLAVVASDTAGQKEIAAQAPKAVAIYPSGNAAVLADRINALLECPGRLAEAKSSALRAAEEIFCWERMEPVLLRSVEKALSRPILSAAEAV